MNEHEITPEPAEVEPAADAGIPPGTEEAPAPEGCEGPAGPAETDPQGEIESLTDKDGRPYDPDLHTIGSRNGKKFLRRRRNPRKPEEPVEVTGPIGGSASFDASGAGLGACALTEIVCVATLGEDWAMHEGERSSMTQAWGAYLDSKGLKDIPPGFILAIALATYAAPRVSKPSTKSRLAAIWTWCGGVWKKSTGWLTRKRPEGP